MSYAPYPAYKDSGVPWLGQVPEGWDGARLSYFFSVQLGKMLQPEAKSTDDVPRLYLRAANIDWAGVKLDDVKEMFFSPSDLEKYALQKGDLLISEGGDVGRASYWDSDQEIFIQNAINRVRPLDTKRVSAKFAFYWFYLLKKAGLIDIQCNSSTIAHFTAEKVKATDFVVPPFEEQTAIADFLDKKTAEIDDLIAKKEELLRLLAEQRTALITHAVTKGLNPNAPMKPSGVVWFDQVPAHWQVRRLKDVGTLTGGAGFPHEFQNVQGEELFFYKVGDLAKSEDGIHLTSAPHTVDRETAAKLRATVIRPDAILYAKIGAALLLNRRRITTADCCIDNNMTAWIVDPSKVHPLWGFYWMSTVDFGEHTNPGAVPSLSEGYQSVLPIALPPLEEQQAIVDQLVTETKAIDQITTKTQKAIERLREYRTALITNAVTGKIKVS